MHTSSVALRPSLSIEGSLPAYGLQASSMSNVRAPQHTHGACLVDDSERCAKIIRTMRMHLIRPLLILLLSLAASGCTKVSENKPPAARSSAPLAAVPPPPRITKADWYRAVVATYSESSVKDEGDGVTSFVACFGDGGKGCGDFAIGKRDAFRKLRHYMPQWSWPGQYTDQYVQTYISLPDCGDPIYFLKPRHFSQRGWLFLNRLSVLSDGELVFDQDLSTFKVDRERLPGGVEEEVSFVPTPAQFDALRKLATATKLSVRITGKKGYVTLKQSDVAKLRIDVASGLRMYDKLLLAVKDKHPSSCSE